MKKDLCLITTQDPIAEDAVVPVAYGPDGGSAATGEESPTVQAPALPVQQIISPYAHTT